jgi:Cu2+-exporting ATPase
MPRTSGSRFAQTGAVTSSTCLHCGAAAEAGGDGFCCTGCRVAHALVVDNGLERYYQLAGSVPLPTGTEPSDRPWLPAVLDAARAASSAGRVSLDVQGITCAACVWVIEKLGEKRGVVCRVNPGVGRVDLTAPKDDAERARLDRFLDDVESIGYRLGPPRKAPDGASDDLLVRTGIAAALAMNAMIFAFSRYFGLDPVKDGDVASWFKAGEVLIATASVAVGGSWFIKSAGRALLRGVIHLDLPIALGVIFAYSGSLLSAWLSSTENAYFDTVSMFIALMLLGRLAQRRLLASSRSMLLADEGLDGLYVRRLDVWSGVGGAPRAVPASAVRAGDRLLVSPRDLIPLASKVIDGEAPFSLAWITGESDPQRFGPGAMVPAGAHHAGTRAVVVEATEDMASSSLQRLLREKTLDDPDASPFWRRYATFSVAAVLTLAAASFVMWWSDGAVRALEITTAVLVVTCPCAIGLAIPLAGELAAARLRKAGVYLRRPGVLDRMLLVKHVVFDKTGTLTVSELRLDDASRASLASLGADDRKALFNLVARSSHPKSRALAAELSSLADDGGRIDSVSDVEEEAGRGLSSSSLDASLLKDAFVRHGHELARFSFQEVLQRDAQREVRALQDAGLDVHLASGDVAGRVREVASRLGLDEAHAHAHMSPEDKAALVVELGKDSVLVLGDGVNDAPAFAVAGVAGTPALDRPQLPARADFVFVGKGVGPLGEMLEAARVLRRASLAAIAFAVAYNSLVVTLAMTGRMTPLLCALLMPGSSLVVITLVSLLMRDRSTSSTRAPLAPPLEVPT